MNVEWSREFDRQLDRMESDDSDRCRQVLQLLAFMLGRLRALDDEPAEESAMFKRVRQSGRFGVWRVSHPYREGVALRLICWFPPERIGSWSPCSRGRRLAWETCSTTPSALAPTGSSSCG